MRYRRWHPPPIMREADLREDTQDDFFRPELHERLRIQRGEKVFAIGSCFARNVEAFLSPHFEVPGRVNRADVPPDLALLAPDLTANSKVWHRYNAFSIRTSLLWALEPEHPSARQRLLEVAADKSLDPYAGCRAILKTADAGRVRNWIDSTVAAVRDCRVIIITLGLSEIWRDRATGLVMNGPPLTEMWTAFPNRFEFAVATCGETMQELNGIHEILTRHCPGDFQIVVTVSPIPLLATFREVDIVVANAASKAILRAAVDQWSRERENVHYFPSYEMILNSSSKGTWMEDFRHCQVDRIRRVVDVFLTEFVTMEQPDTPLLANDFDN